MRRFLIGLTVTMITVLGASGCGNGGTAATTAPPGPETPTAAGTPTAAETPAVTESTPAAPAESPQAPDEDSWETVVTLSSSDPSMEGYEDVLVSEPFLAVGEAQLVLDMPDAGGVDGILPMVMPAEWATDLATISSKLLDERTINVTLAAALPPEQLGNLDDTYVIIVLRSSVIGDGEWTIQLQTR